MKISMIYLINFNAKNAKKNLVIAQLAAAA